MQDFPHQYKVKAQGQVSGSLVVHSENLPDIDVAPPKQFGGPGDKWSPEDLFMAAIANCLVLSFRAIATASKLEWNSIECDSEGDLDKVERKLQFTNVRSRVRLSIPSTESEEKALRLLHKAHETCLISNSISCQSSIECEVVFDGEN